MNLENFRALYEQHVRHVVDGDMTATIADMVPENIPGVFAGVEVPREGVSGVDVRDVRAEGERFVGEAVYHTTTGDIGLRSIWVERDGRWLAAELENFSVSVGA